MAVFIDGGGGLDFEQDDPPPAKRTEQLFVSDEYRIFMIAGRPDPFTRDLNHICVRPFHTFPPETVERLRAQATPWTEKDSAAKITIRVDDAVLELKDCMNGVISCFPISELDEEVRHDILYTQRLRVFNGSDNRDEKVDPWQKYAGLDLKSIDAAVTTGSEISVPKRVTLKKPGLSL
jgi:hypothetical protein